MKQQLIAIYQSNVNDNTSPQFENSYYRTAYSNLFYRLLHLGAQPVVVYDAKNTYSGNGTFTRGWFAELAEKSDDASDETQDSKKVKYRKLETTFKADLLYDKNRFPFSDIPKLNPDRVKKICNDKYKTYLFAPDFHSKSYSIWHESELEVFGLSHPDCNIALKELDSYGGEKVFVGRFADYKNDLNFPLIAQEFIDTSGGTPNRQLAEGYHDVRIRLFDGQPIGGSLRIPKAGTLKSNQHLGGQARALYVRELPAELVEKTAELDARFGVKGHRFFAADWGFDKTSGEWKLFELNNMPGLAHRSVDGPAADEYLQLLAENLVKAAQR